jgi:RNA polymerase sigma-70 factor (ECF subfamily)
MIAAVDPPDPHDDPQPLGGDMEFGLAGRTNLRLVPARSESLDDHEAPPTQHTANPDRQVRDARLAALLGRAANGDAKAFEDFYDATVGYAQALARRMLNPSDLEDVLSEAYFQVWRSAASFDVARGSAVTWLLLIVRSRALDWLRKPRELQALEEGDEAAEQVDPYPTPPDLLETTEANRGLHQALLLLNGKERWVLSLAYFKDMSHGEISSATGMPLGTVKSLINRAQDKLRKHLGGAHD